MKENLQLTIVTPAYNRVDCLPRLYESFKKQTKKEFQWIVIDDGSVDDTENYLNSINSDKNEFLYEHYRKDNGGKHTALNYSHKYIKGEWVCIVDSDDYLLPTAVEEILNAIRNWGTTEHLGVISFLKGYSQNDPVNISFPLTPILSNHIDFRINGHRGGDCCEIIKSEILKEHPFPEFKNERFMGEGYLWNYTGFHYNTVYINNIVYICEYLEGGLSNSGRSLRIKCPYGGMANCNSFFESVSGRRVNMDILIKEGILFVCYAKFAGLGFWETIQNCKKPFLAVINFAPGLLLYFYWKRKYV